MLRRLLFLLLTLMTFDKVRSEETNNNRTEHSLLEGTRIKKALSVFQVVRFPNTVCSGTSSYNGTCYTSSECLSKGGTSSGTCASGFGVCCLFVLSCGGSSSQNCTYLVQSSTTSLSSPCTYTICPGGSNVCRIRLDFTTFAIANPASGTAAAGGDGTTKGASLGDCVTDSFSITTPGSEGTPVICGFNSGQHMIVDASTACHQANFQIGATTTTSRTWNIKVTQYPCNTNNLGGPDGCLQYFTGKTGTISSYNFPTTSTTVPVTAQHLSNQCYQICIRREAGSCFICFAPTISMAPSGQTSFGLSISPSGTIAQSAVNEACTTDYVMIPGGAAQTPAASTTPSLPTSYRICGRFFNTMAAAIANDASVCTRLVPFRITFKTNQDELLAIADDAMMSELAFIPSGTIGFSLKYSQGNC